MSYFLTCIKSSLGLAEFITVDSLLETLKNKQNSVLITFYRSNKNIFLEDHGRIYQCEADTKFSTVLDYAIANNLTFKIKNNSLDLFKKMYEYLLHVLLPMCIAATTAYYWQHKQVTKIEECKQLPNKKLDDIYSHTLVKQKFMTLIKKMHKKQHDVKDKFILLSGPPGTGKTCLANAFATELKSDYIYKMTGFDIIKNNNTNSEFLQNLFKVLKNKNAVLFIDEIDALACNEYLLIEFTDIMRSIKDSDEYQNVVILLATNKFNKISPHFKHFNKIFLSLPTQEERLEILNGYALKYFHTVSPELKELLVKISLDSQNMSCAQLSEIFDDFEEGSVYNNDCLKKIEDAYNFVKKQEV